MTGSDQARAIEFRIDDEPVDGETHVLAVVGEVDLFTAPEFKQRISAAIDTGRTRVVVDLSGVSFIDSSSLGVLIGANKRLRQRDGHMVIVCANRSINHTFKITGLDSVFTIVAERAEAIAA